MNGKVLPTTRSTDIGIIVELCYVVLGSLAQMAVLPMAGQLLLITDLFHLRGSVQSPSYRIVVEKWCMRECLKGRKCNP